MRKRVNDTTEPDTTPLALPARKTLVADRVGRCLVCRGVLYDVRTLAAGPGLAFRLAADVRCSCNPANTTSADA